MNEPPALFGAGGFLYGGAKVELASIIERLSKAYGPRGWWPLPSRAGLEGRNDGGYRNASSEPIGPDFVGPAREARRSARFEIAVGAVLAQNTAWRGASKATAALAARGLLSPAVLLRAEASELEALLRPAGTYARKALYLKTLAAAWPVLDSGVPSRAELLKLRGIGYETADCILCYCYGEPRFVADAYARRIAARCGAAAPGLSYEELRLIAEAALAPDAAYLAEAHALLVEHAKRRCRAKPQCAGCALERDCPTARE